MVSEWRLIEPEPPGPATAAPPPTAQAGQPARLIAVAAALAVLGAIGLAIWTTLPAGGVQLDLSAPVAGDPLETDTGAVEVPPSLAPAVLVDVQGAVARPGLHQLPPGSRVGDAIEAAGGYSGQVDIAAAAAAINLAQPLADGAKIVVPVYGWRLSEPSAPAAESTSAGGPIDINTASADQLDTLPGIGPVTAAKIIAAREVAPFASVDELLSREVLGPATYEKVRPLVVVAR